MEFSAGEVGREALLVSGTAGRWEAEYKLEAGLKDQKITCLEVSDC